MPNLRLWEIQGGKNVKENFCCQVPMYHYIGTGTTITAKLTEGTHTICVCIKNKYVKTWSDSISIVVGAPTSYANTFGMEFNLIPHGTFIMGSPEDEPRLYDDETQHEVTLTRSFYIQTTEITQGQWETVLTDAEKKGISIGGLNKWPSDFSDCGPDCPVERVSWDDIQLFINIINQLGEGRYRLPTEAEWEYAARAGSTTAFANGGITEMHCALDPNLDDMGWYCYNNGTHGTPEFGTKQVMQKDANNWGLYDMHGNVYEWCQDWFDAYPSGSLTDPTGPLSGGYLIIRGGSWIEYAMNCRSGHRLAFESTFQDRDIGFRLARSHVRSFCCLQKPIINLND